MSKLITWHSRPRRSVWGSAWTYVIHLPELDPVIEKGILLPLGQYALGRVQQHDRTITIGVSETQQDQLIRYLENVNYRLENPLWE